MIGYYVHHHGYGHATTAALVAHASPEPMVALSSMAPSSDWTAAFTDVVTLPRDDLSSDPSDPRANGCLHWAPLADTGYTKRMLVLAAWVRAAQPRAVVVDVSVEVTALMRLLGVPVVVMGLPGARTDEAHRLCAGLATRVVAPWPADVYRAPWLEPARARLVHVGSFSRFDGRPVEPPHGTRRVLVLAGAGGSSVTEAEIRSARSATPDWNWRLAGGPGPWSADVWTELMRADVVVTHAGRNAVAEVAAARRPAVVIPQPRPFGEQEVVARALSRAGLAAAAPAWPASERWPGLLTEASALGGETWSRWNSGSGAKLAAAAVVATADEHESGTPSITRVGDDRDG